MNMDSRKSSFSAELTELLEQYSKSLKLEQEPSKVINNILEEKPEWATLDQIESIKHDNLLQELEEVVLSWDEGFESFAEKASAQVLQFNKGISLLDVKNNLLLSYYQYSQLYMLFKLQGRKMSRTGLPLKLIYIKTLLNKLKPLEKKLEYQIEKQLKMHSGSSDPLALRPQVEALSKTKEIVAEGKKDVYVAPKIAPQLSKDDRQTEKTKRETERKQKMLLKKPLISDLEEELGDNPIFKQMSDKHLLSKEERDIERFEEENFTRINLSKKEKIRLKKQREKKTAVQLDDTTEFDNIKTLLQHQGMIEGEVQKKTLKRNIKDFKEQKYDPNLEEFGRKKNRNKKIQKKVKK